MEKSWNCVFEFLWEPCYIKSLQSCFKRLKPMYYQGDSHAVIAQIWYLKYTCSGPLHFPTTDLFIALIYVVALEHEY